MSDFTEHDRIAELLKEAQGADHDMREASRECHLFVDKRDGQWEPYWWQACDGKPRYTFDMTSAIIDQVAGRIQQMDFDIKVRPGDGATSKAEAEVFDGIIRTIEAQSGANYIYSAAARKMLAGGVDGWHIVQQYADSDSFDQDLMIKPVANWVDSVWLDPNSKRQDASDASYGFVLEAITKDAYKKRFKDGPMVSVSTDRTGTAYYYKADQVVIGQMYYAVEEPRTIVLTSAGRVFEKGPDLEAVIDEMAMTGETIIKERNRPRRVIYSRLFDGKDWLGDPKKTVFSYVPLVPLYGNFKTFEDKITYRGVVEKMLDAQRVYNYTKSREIEEGALAPRAKYWMTQKQAAGHEKQLRTMNTNADPVQFFNVDLDMPGYIPQQNGGAQINQGLIAVSESMRQIMGQVAGMFAASMGDNPGLQSGVAIEKLQDKGDIGTDNYVRSLEIAIAHTGRILVDAIPRAYDTERQMQILGPDGADEVVTINQPIWDIQSQRFVVMNDLSKGRYAVSCTAGPSFRSKQSETVAAITELATVDPSILVEGSDILLNNIPAPGMDLIAARKRRALLNAGVIPQDQMTEQELAELQAAQQQPQPPDPNMVLAEAEVRKAEAQTQRVLVQAQKDQLDIQLRAQKDEREAQEAAAKVALQQRDTMNRERELEIRQMEALIKQQQAQFDQMMKMQQQTTEAVLTQARALNEIRQAMGADAIISPGGAIAYERQAGEVIKAQSENR